MNIDDEIGNDSENERFFLEHLDKLGDDVSKS